MCRCVLHIPAIRCYKAVTIVTCTSPCIVANLIVDRRDVVHGHLHKPYQTKQTHIAAGSESQVRLESASSQSRADIPNY